MPDRASKEPRGSKNRNHKNSLNVLPGGVLLFAFLMKAGGQSLKPEERAFCFFAWIHPVSRFSPMRRKKRRQAAFYCGGVHFPTDWVGRHKQFLN
jgi:hypothetical protein